ncbi:hypothetical protein [Actinoplanes sp. L3-i22]|uniref:hypothetical protein n=1 Tax=Actinoplanes sp. L3-i22 TaxID=2836373 RepID=UPI001C7891D8|nr:hypothetical protein [Actinoplanes sp. L3-i22]BCY08657.1 hypothetical protein L3i22_037450 [Actinoplanes sp. L3-i22]
MEPVRTRRAFTALAVWYAVVWCLPGALAAVVNASTAGSMPGYTEVNGRLEKCGGMFCPTAPADVPSVLVTTALVLAPSLLVAVPLCAYLTRRWEMPRLAGFVSALLGWVALCAGYGIWLSLRTS